MYHVRQYEENILLVSTKMESKYFFQLSLFEIEIQIELI